MSPIGYLVSSLLVVVAGLSVGLQQMLNANLRAQLDSPWWAGVVSYAGGTLVMVTAALCLAGRPRFVGWHGGSWVSWTGGLFGAIFIAITVTMVPRLGAATVLALIVVGQMVGAIAFDHFGLFGLMRHPVNWARVAGVACLLVGVALVRR